PSDLPYVPRGRPAQGRLSATDHTSCETRQLTSHRAIVPPTYVQNPSIEKFGTTHSVNRSIATLTKKYAIPNVRRINGSAMNVRSGLRKAVATPRKAPAKRSRTRCSTENPEKAQSATISPRTLLPHWTSAATTHGTRAGYT